MLFWDVSIWCRINPYFGKNIGLLIAVLLMSVERECSASVNTNRLFLRFQGLMRLHANTQIFSTVFVNKVSKLWVAISEMEWLGIWTSFHLSVRQTTQYNISPSFYVSIPWSTYQISQKCKTDTSFSISNHFFLNWLFSWEFGKEIFSQNWKEE